ncbi:autophagy protein 13, variant 2 [Entomophthora muscae]|uniref:Autophagy protein 13, variant 2 n=1 Tax=Entomophthora muscae TaxID=34485 RepID=A0ACC2UJ63_9FUNG|nr:autophagy protein 13, variant 2 [Entomophthora muscae]
MHSHRLSSSSISVSPPPSPQPNTTSIPNKASRADQIVQSFYGKIVQVVLQSRVVPLITARDHAAAPQQLQRPSTGIKQNRWFNLETDEIEVFKTDASCWRNASITGDHVPPLIIEIFLDASELSASQSLVLVDEQQQNHKIELNQGGGFHQFGRSATTLKKTILLESWCLLLSGAKDCQLELPTIYKHGITYFRSLQSFVKILPASSLNQRLKKFKKYGLKIGYRLLTAVSTIETEIGFGHPASSDDNILRTSRIDLAPFDSPIGKLSFAVTTRRLCDFRIEDSEKLISAKLQFGSGQNETALSGSRNSFNQQFFQDPSTSRNFGKGSGIADNSQYNEPDSQASSLTSLGSGVGNRDPVSNQPYTFSTSPVRWSHNRELGTRSRPCSQDQDALIGLKGTVAAFSNLLPRQCSLPSSHPLFLPLLLCPMLHPHRALAHMAIVLQFLSSVGCSSHLTVLRLHPFAPHLLRRPRYRRLLDIDLVPFQEAS